MKEVTRRDEVSTQAAMELALRSAHPTKFASLLDRVIEPFAPERVHKRMKARTDLAMGRAMLAYSAANFPFQSMQRQGVAGSLTSEDAQLPGWTRFQMILECRDQYANMPIIRAGVNGQARRSVGTGIHPIWHTSDKTWNRKTRKAYEQWACSPDITGRFDMDSIDRASIRAAYVDGDMGVRLINEYDGAPLKLQLVEADMIAENNRTNIGQDNYNPIGGCWVDWDTGQVYGYQVGQRGMGGLLFNSQFESANDFLLLFRKQRVDQYRGVPLMAPIVQTSRDLDRYLTATRMQANIAATYGVVVKKNMPGPFSQAASIPSRNGNYRTQPLKTGLMTWLNPDEDISMFKPDVPGPQFDSFSKFLVRMVAVGMGITYEYLMQDFSNMSFSSSRTNLLDMTLTMKEWQRWNITEFKKPVVCIWLAKEMDAGRIPYNPEAFDEIAFQTPAELGVDPQKDADANIKLLTAGLETFQNIYQQDGLDWEQQIEQKALESAYIANMAEKHGIDPKEISSLLPPGVLKTSEMGPDGEKVKTVANDITAIVRKRKTASE